MPDYWEDWILYVLEAISETASYTLKKVNAIKQLLDDTVLKMKKEHSKIYSRELAELLFHQPYCKIDFIVKNNIAARNAAGRYLKELSDSGILKEHKIGREILYLNVELYNLLTV